MFYFLILLMNIFREPQKPQKDFKFESINYILNKYALFLKSS